MNIALYIAAAVIMAVGSPGIRGCGSDLDRRTHLRLDRTVPPHEQGLRAPRADF